MSELEPRLFPATNWPVSHSRARVTALVRGDDVRGRSERAARRLLRLVAAWGPQTVLEMTYGATAARSNLVTLDVLGVVPRSWQADLAWAWNGVGTLKKGPGATPLERPGPVLELRPHRAVLAHSSPPRAPGHDAVQDEMLRNARLRQERPWPRAMHADLAELLALNLEQSSPGLVLRTRLSGASALEESMLRDELLATYDRGDLGDYLGSPVRMRVLLAAHEAPPARARALVAEWGSDLDLVPVHEAEADQVWSGDSLSLAGHAIPAGTALAGLRVPVAGLTTFPGMATTHAAVSGRALDPVPPRPRRAVRIGRAQTAAQRWTAVGVDLRDLLQHVFVQGMSGSGKSTLLATIATGVMDAGGTVTLLDPEGSTVDLVLRHMRAQHAGRSRVVRHGSADLDAPLNLLTGDPDERQRMVDLFSEMIQRSQDPRAEGIVGPRWKRWFSLISMATATLLEREASLVAVAAIASDMDRVRSLAQSIKELDPDLSHRLLQEYGRLEGKEAFDLVSWAMSKLQEIIGGERARWIFGAGPDGVDVRYVLDHGQNLLVDLGAHRLGEPVARAIGATYLLKHWASLGARTDRTRPHVIIIDESHLFSYGPLPRLLAEARKFGVGVVIATQHLGQLTGELADALESNTGSFVSLRCGLSSASRASVRLAGWPAEELVRLPDLTAATTVSRDGVLSAPFTLHVDQHARMRRLALQGEVGEHVAREVLASSQALATAYSALTAPTDAEVCRLIGPVVRRRPRPGPPPRDPLEDWLAENRKAAQVDG